MTVAITDVVLRDAHQSCSPPVCVSTICCPLPLSWTTSATAPLSAGAAPPLMPASAFSARTRGSACAELKKAMPKTPLQMLLRGQNLLGYRHYADDVVERFVERAVKNGMDVFPRLRCHERPAQHAGRPAGGPPPRRHAQGTLSYTTSPAHTLQTWLDLTEQLLETGVDSVAIKDMSRHSDAACRL
ncbi:oxaloacetate decarboxylase [Klebsiella pneumoniae]|uniref:Oxaloacetate decarboxylase n=1 Tax=Klebsiella pneumoniae TaxID=573 RepID=A0A2X3CQB4_KLEPN|nr:oxaloacetate decarboxylase [Klebsiella pneumoniae]